MSPRYLCGRATGVFKATLLVSFPAEARPAVLAAFVLCRLIYNILPFCLSIAR